MEFENHIDSRNKLFDLKLREIWKYRDLLFLFVWRDFVAKYKQTILGPAWFVIQPLFEVLVFTIIFGNIAGLSTDGAPKAMFYLSGVTCWGFFSLCLISTSSTFTANSGLFEKVYFPRIITPLSIVVSNSIQFALNLLIFIIMYFIYLARGSEIAPTFVLWLFPFIAVFMAMMGLGLGMIVSSMTTKYRDLQKVITFGANLLMYATPVVYPLSILENSSHGFDRLILLNPMVGIIETFRYATIGVGDMHWGLLAYSFVFGVVVFLVGTIIFNRTEKNFMDTV